MVRNGGPFDNNKIRQVIQPASNLTWTGLWSSDLDRLYVAYPHRDGKPAEIHVFSP